MDHYLKWNMIIVNEMTLHWLIVNAKDNQPPSLQQYVPFAQSRITER